MDRWIFYKKNFEDFVEKKSNILIISASSKEINVLKELGYYNFSITFHDSNEKEKLIELGFEENKNLFKADIRNLPFENNAFDYVITNATIHHVDIPHKAVTEMYRISSKGTLIIESNDSIVMQLATKMKLAEEFEISSVEGNTGGLLDTGIPNYVYRWTEREVQKLLMAFDPKNINTIYFNYENDLTNFNFNNGLFKKVFLKILIFLTRIYFLVFKKQQNCMSIFIDKTRIRKRFET
tara:strand:- start:1613 stop:2326 length:714 start_codon:yes stop_codon:yes gene_type:complete